MKDYTVLEELKISAASKIEIAFERGYEQGFNDCHSELTEEEAKDHYNEGYNDGYEKGLQHGQELRAKEVECAEACGMKRAWEAARKIVLTKENGGIPLSDLNEIFGAVNVLKEFSASEVIEKIDAWEKKQEQEQEQSKKCCKDCNHYCGDDNKFKCDIKGLLCIERDRWTPKQNASEMNVDSIEVGDEAYQKGFNSALAVKAEILEMERNVGYEKGLDEAWKSARKICTNWCISDRSLAEIFGKGHTIDDIMRLNSASEAIAKIKEYEEKQKQEEASHRIYQIC